MRNKRKTTASFIEECEKKHGNFYDYSNVVYTGCYQKEGESEFIYNLEKHYHRTFRDYRYQPKVLFKGSSECFSITFKDYDFRRDESLT